VGRPEVLILIGVGLLLVVGLLALRSGFVPFVP
jgi:hypothetical protein